ncbi:MAG: NusG domain II-containing protein [Clostridia bacterium]|nr:NusG domain II-containing protein [Clostridia bacterium]
MKTREKRNSSQKNKRFRNDGILAAVIIIIAVAVLLFMKLTREQGNSVVVKIDGVETYRYSLSESVELEVKTGDGNYNVVVIKDGKVSVVDADCPDGICEEYRPISYVGETIVCLPHKMVVEVVSDSADTGLDAVI